MSDRSEGCEHCAGESAIPACGGPAGHALYSAIRAIRRPPRELAELLGTDIEQLNNSDPASMRGFLRNLRWSLLCDITRLAGLTIDEMVKALTGASHTGRTNYSTGRVLAVILHHAPHGCTASEVATLLAWPEPGLARAQNPDRHRIAPR